MIKILLLDVDGIVIHREMYFSQRFSREFGVSPDLILPFFKNQFQRCLAGRADLKEELKNYLKQWRWEKSVEDLLAYWFQHESDLDKKMLKNVKLLRSRGLKCYLETNNEKYRVRYLLEKLDLKSYFDGVFTSTALGFLKPDTDFWASIYDRLGQPAKNEVLVWDDDEENVRSAENFGFLSEVYTDFQAYERKMKGLAG